MQDILSLPPAKLLKALDPETAEGRTALASLSEEQVGALRARVSLSTAKKTVLDFFEEGGRTFLLIIFSVLSPFFTLWFSLSESSLVTYGVIALILLSAVIAFSLSLALTTRLLNRFVSRPLALNKAFEPLASRPGLCVDALDVVKRYEPCQAYRDRVIEHRPLVYSDYLALRAILREALRESANRESQAQRAAEELACKELHGVPVPDVQPS